MILTIETPCEKHKHIHQYIVYSPVTLYNIAHVVYVLLAVRCCSQDETGCVVTVRSVIVFTCIRIYFFPVK